MANLRLFTAFRLPQDTLRSVVVIQNDLRNRLGNTDFRWVNDDNLHSTIHFLGDTPDDRVREISTALDEAIATARIPGPIRLTLAAPGAFPSAGRPRTLWIGVDNTDAKLVELERVTRQALSSCGVHLDSRPYRPHITVGYTRRRASKAGLKGVADALRSIDVDKAEFSVTSLLLVKSVVGPGGSKYTDLHEARLS